MGLGLLILVLLNADDPGPSSSRILAALAFVMIVLTPGVLALLGRRRPALFLAAGVVGFPIGFLTFSVFALPLMLPACMAFIAYGRRSGDMVPRVAAPLTALVALLLALTSFGVLLLHEDPRCQAIANGTTCSSDIVTTSEALASLALSGSAVVIAWSLARQQR